MEAPWLIRTSTHSTCPLKAARSRGVRPWLFLTSRSSRDCTRTSIAWWWPWYAWKVDSPIKKLLLTLVTCTAHQKDKTKCFKLLTARCRGLTGALTSASFRMSVPEVSISWISQDTHENLIQILFPFLLHDSVPYFIYIKTTKKYVKPWLYSVIDRVTDSWRHHSRKILPVIRLWSLAEICCLGLLYCNENVSADEFGRSQTNICRDPCAHWLMKKIPSLGLNQTHRSRK